MSNVRPWHLSAGCATDIGRRRASNQDSLVSIPGYGVFCIADGMGGTDAGELASSSVVEHLRRAFKESVDQDPNTTDARLQRIVNALGAANGWIRQSITERGLTSCGTTAVILAFDVERPDRAVTLHAGDSRAYRYRDGELEQLTCDHSFATAAGFEDENLIPARFRSVITRAVGISDEISLDETETNVARDDLFLLCSDGLTRMVPDRDICLTMRQFIKDSPQDIADELVRKANEAGGLDNISVIVVRVDGLASTSSEGKDFSSRARRIGARMRHWLSPIDPDIG